MTYRGRQNLQPTSGLNEKDRDWVDSKLTPQPIGVSLQPIRLTGARDTVLRKAYVRATDFPSDPLDNALTKARKRGWRTYDVPSGHDVMIDAPDSLSRRAVRTAAALEESGFYDRSGAFPGLGAHQVFILMQDNQFHNFIIIMMILTSSHDSAIRWKEVLRVL